MRKLMSRKILICMIIMISFILLGCTNTKNINDKGSKTEALKFDDEIKDLGAWAAYWQIDVSNDIKSLDSKLTSLSYFEVYFDKDNNLVMPDKLSSFYEETKDSKYEKYITIVNDKIISEDNKLLKDTGVLKEIFKNSESMDNHIEDIISLAKKYNFDGIEIDYEQIKNDEALWNKYSDFMKKLYDRAAAENLKLRAVLEPSIPYDKINFPQGIEYVIMCYNLYGTQNEPGEKANPQFIQQVIDKSKYIPGNKKYAVATGGIDWEDNKNGISIDEVKAEEIIKKYNAEVKRDKESGCVVFNYTDENKNRHEVWYADKLTLNEWMKVIYKNGYTASLWKLGGNKF